MSLLIQCINIEQNHLISLQQKRIELYLKGHFFFRWLRLLLLDVAIRKCVRRIKLMSEVKAVQ